ncbi:MAG: hypothetical protein WA820_11605 [Bradyrhizobium sp.]
MLLKIDPLAGLPVIAILLPVAVTAVEYLETLDPDNGHALSLATMASAS